MTEATLLFYTSGTEMYISLASKVSEQGQLYVPSIDANV